MRELLSVSVDGGRRARIVHSTRSDGDLSPSTVDPDTLIERRRALTGDRPWHVLRQVHGASVADADLPEPHVTAGARPQADAAVTVIDDRVVAVHTGDCVPVGLAHPHGVVAVAHAGWKGLEAGVLAATVSAVRERVDDRPIHAVVGPHVRAGCYEFGPTELERLADRFGPGCIGRTHNGRPALDLTAITIGELERLDVRVQSVSPDCTATLAEHYWSHRARSETGRIAMAGWLEPT